MTYENENPYAGYDSNGASPQELLARLTALQSHISSTVTKLGEAESKIEQQAEQILLTVRKDEIISAINLSPEEIDIISSRINLYGAVTVLSDITGELGTITAGDIFGVNIYGAMIAADSTIDVGTSVSIGKQLNLGVNLGVNDFKINFGDVANITVGMYNSGEYHIEHHAFQHDFYGRVDFSNATVSGLNVTVSFG